MNRLLKRKAFVCLSGGLDSTVTLYRAMDEFNNNVEAISFDYGQRHLKEAEYAAKTCAILGIRHSVVGLGGLLSGSGVMLTDSSVAVPDISYSDIKGVSPTYVPFRNGTMLAVMAALAQKYVTDQIEGALDKFYGEKSDTPNTELQRARIDQNQKGKMTNAARDLCAIYAGQHRDDGLNWAYPDCTMEFLGAMANAIYTGTYFTIRLVTPYVFASKAQIVADGHKLFVPFQNTWSCYKGEEHHCGICPTCRSRKEAFIIANIPDPTIYADEQARLSK